jgi:hypothetical protein
MAISTRTARRRDSFPIEVDSAALLVGLKQPLFTAQSRSSSCCRKGVGILCVALSCFFVGFSLATVLKDVRFHYERTSVILQGGRSRPSAIQVCSNITLERPVCLLFAYTRELKAL